MELLVNSLIGMVILIFDVARGLLEWADQGLLIGAGVAAGAYVGTREALTRHERSTTPSRR